MTTLDADQTGQTGQTLHTGSPDSPEAAAQKLAELTGAAHHDVAVVLGSGWVPAADAFGEPDTELPVTDLPGFTAPTVAGHGARVRSVAVAGRRVLVSHFPYRGDSKDGPDRYRTNRPLDRGLPILHGHVHTEFAERGRQFNVGVDVRDYAPVAEDTIVAWLATLG